MFAEIDYDAEHVEERLKATKRRKLQAIEKSNKPSSDESSQATNSYTFVEKLTAQIIKNVQVRLHVVFLLAVADLLLAFFNTLVSRCCYPENNLLKLLYQYSITMYCSLDSRSI